MKAKEFLERYETARDRAALCRSRLRQAESRRDDLSVPDEPGHSTSISNRTERAALRVIEARAEYDRAVAEADAIQAEIEQTVLLMPDPMLARLLYDRYVRLLRWQDVAEGLVYSEEYTRGALHWRALEELEKVLTD